MVLQSVEEVREEQSSATRQLINADVSTGQRLSICLSASCLDGEIILHNQATLRELSKLFQSMLLVHASTLGPSPIHNT